MAVDELESIRCTWGNGVAWRCLRYIYENTVEESCLRKLLVQHCVKFLPVSILRDNANDIPKEFLMDYIDALLS
jgi:hypothetical protein